MKGIIVVDIPETCLDCNFCEEFDEGTLAMCSLLLDENKLYGRVIDADYCQDKPDWCPIKPVPSKYRGLTNFECGFNHCVDEILKGE